MKSGNSVSFIFFSLILSLLVSSPKTIAKSKAEGVGIDLQGFVYKNGKKIFPIGLYVTTVDSDDLSRIKSAGFNTILSYSFRDLNHANDFLDLAGKYDLNVIYSLKDYYKGLKWAPKDIESPGYVDGYVNAIKTHGSLLAWYINDELPLTKLPEIKKMADKINKLDGGHPVLQVLYEMNTVHMYSKISDIIALHAYPVGVKRDLLLSTLAAEKVVGIAGNKQSPWLVPQIMDFSNYRKGTPKRPPSIQEMQNQTYQGIIAGAKGIVFYSYYDLFYDSYPRTKKDLKFFNARWPDIVAMMKNINPIIPVILNDGVVYKDQFRIKGDVKYKFYKYDGKTYLLLANPFYHESVIEFKDVGDEFSFKNVSLDIKFVKTDNSLSLILPALYSGYITD